MYGGGEESEATIETMSGNDRGLRVALHKWTVVVVVVVVSMSLSCIAAVLLSGPSAVYFSSTRPCEIRDEGESGPG